jgi:hypothetical protein
LDRLRSSRAPRTPRAPEEFVVEPSLRRGSAKPAPAKATGETGTPKPKAAIPDSPGEEAAVSADSPGPSAARAEDLDSPQQKMSPVRPESPTPRAAGAKPRPTTPERPSPKAVSAPRVRLDVAVQVRLANGQTHCRVFDRADTAVDVRTWVAALMGMSETEYSLRIEPGGREFPAGADVSLGQFAPACALRAQFRGTRWGITRVKEIWKSVRTGIADWWFLADARGDPADFWRSAPPGGRAG